MTPMIDMTFQLIAFFMVLINFAEVDRNERIRLPRSALAKPPDAPVSSPLTLQLTRQGTVIVAGEEMPVAGLRRVLPRERQVSHTVVIRADGRAQTGKVQEIIDACQKSGFQKFTLRAKCEPSERM